MANIVRDLGVVTAYGAAVVGGYTGTYAEFCAQQAEYADNAAAVEQAKTDASTAAGTATTKASEASASASAAATSAQAAQSALAGMTFVSFAVQSDGHVYISNSDLLGTTSFVLTEDGHMEVTY